MPIYEYSCDECKTKIETAKSIKDESPEICVVCKKEMRKLISRSSFVLKGGGWASEGYHKPHITFKNRDGSKETIPYNPNKISNE